MSNGLKIETRKFKADGIWLNKANTSKKSSKSILSTKWTIDDTDIGAN